MGVYMQKYKVSSMLLFFGFYSFSVQASNSVSLNYAYGKERGAESMHGYNVLIKHDLNDFGLMLSGTYIDNTKEKQNVYIKNKYASFMPGVAYNFTNDTSIYGLAGISCGSNVQVKQNNEIYGAAFGTGVLINVSHNVQLNIGYELGLVSGKEINTFTTGVGYVF